MYALARILEDDPTPSMPLTVCTDSEYVINGMSHFKFITLVPSLRSPNHFVIYHSILIMD